MGLFFNPFIKPYYEADIDGGKSSDSEETTDYTTSQDQENSTTENNTNENDSQNSNENADENDSNEENQGQDSEEPVDYTTDNSEEDSDNEGEGYDDNQPSSSSQEDDEEPVDELKAKEEELYSTLTPGELDIKHRELKNQYLAMYDMITSIIDRLGDASVQEDHIKTIEYISSTLIDLKSMVADYVNDVYQTKSYMENSINYNRFLATLNGVNRILEEIDEKED